MSIDRIFQKYKKMPVTVRASVLFTLCGLLQKGISFLVVPIYTRLMPAADYGVYSVFFSWYQLLMIFTTLNMWNYLINNGLTDFGERRYKFISSLQGLAALITIVWFIVYLVFSGDWEKWSGLTFPMMLFMFAELLTMPSYEYWCAVKRYDYDARGIVITAIIIAVATPLIAIPMILLSSDKGFAAIAAKSGVSIAVYLVVAIKMLRKEHKLYDKDFWRYALGFNLPLIPHFLSMILLQSSDRIMIERICGATDAAIYSVAYNMSLALTIFNSAILNTFIPYTYQSLKEGNEKKIGKRAIPLVILIGLINFAVVLFAPEIITILAPHEYQVAVYVIPPVTMSNLLMFLFNLFANIEYYFKETKMVATASVISALFNIILNFIFVKKYGFIAAGYTTVVCYALFSLCHYLFMRKVSKKHLGGRKIYDERKLLLITVCFIAISFSTSWLYNQRFMMVRYSILIILAFVALKKRKRIKALLKE